MVDAESSTGRERRLSLILVLSSMARDTQGDEIFCSVVPQHAAQFPVLDLQVSKRAAQLTTIHPSVGRVREEGDTVLIRVSSGTWARLACDFFSVRMGI